MKTTIAKTVATLLRTVLRARYDVLIRGEEHLETTAPTLILPNHVALIDPVILTAFFANRKILSPLVSETYYKMPAFKPLFDLVSAVPIADIQRGGGHESVRDSIASVTRALASGRSVLMYPSGQIYLQGFESVVWKKAAHSVVANLPEGVRVLTVRTTGLWGSLFSKAFEGGAPRLPKALARAVSSLAFYGLFFLPKRRVTVEIEDRTDELKRLASEGVSNFNADLEAWYNKHGKEPCVFLRHSPFFNDVEGKTEPKSIAGSLADLASSRKSGEVSPETLAAVAEEIVRIKETDLAKITKESGLMLDLEFDSLDVAELKTSVQNRFPGAGNPPTSSLKTVLDLALMAEGKTEADEIETACDWKMTEGTDLIVEATENPVASMVAMLRRKSAEPFLYDALSGMLTRRDVLVRSLLVSKKVPKDQERVAVMLPASAGAAIVLFSAYLAARTPVVLNWTSGETAFAHTFRHGGAKKILTSRKFFEKAAPDWMREKYVWDCLFLEDLLSNVTLIEKLFALVKSYLPIPVKSSKEAGVLFTSGSESLPKAVVLSWTNVVSDIRGSIAVMPVKSDDVLFSFLPVFHSFGFTIGTLLPLFSGLKTAYSPNPNDGRTVALGMKKTKATILTSTPTFFTLAREASKAGDFSALRKLVVGAEKCPKDLFESLKITYPKVVILEGYGITECSPVVSINPPAAAKFGSVGLPIPGCEVRIFPLDGSEKECASGEQGMIYTKGQNVFGGYVDSALASPFETVAGAEYYKTGDLGYLDSEGYLFITGRLKRFVKIAGEMVSLPAIESMLSESFPSASGLSEFAVEAKEDDGNVTIVCFGTVDRPLSDLNAALRQKGAAGIVRIDAFRLLSELPLL